MAEVKYQPNSHRSKELAAEASREKERKIEKVVTGKVKTKSNNARHLANIFISEDAGNVKSYLFLDVFVPALKKLISDVVRDGVDMLLYGKSQGNRSSGSKVSYRSYYDSGSSNRRENSDTRVRSRFDYDDLIFDSRGEAEAVRKKMEDVVDRYGFVSVADMYDMADLTAPYTASKYGWTSVRNSEVVRINGGYIIKLPSVVPLD